MISTVRKTKNRIPTSYNNRELYKYFVDHYKRPDVSYSTYISIVTDALNLINHFTIEESDLFLFPLLLGEYGVRKKKMNFQAYAAHNKFKVDYEYLKKTGKVVYHLNEHRGGFKYEFHWDKRRMGPIKNKLFYKFYPSRKNKRRLATILKTDFTKDYFEK